MKKIIVCLLVTFIAFAGDAQPIPGIFAGPQMTASKYTVYGKKQPNTWKYGFNAGFMLKVPFDNKLYFSPLAFYSLKGYKVRFNQRVFPPDTLAVDNNTTIHTFELGALLHYDFGNNHGFFLRFGPSLDFQLFGNEKFNKTDNTSVDKQMKFDFANYGRFGANMLLHVGYETKSGFVFTAQYTHGMGSINNADGGPRIRHRAFGISIGKYLKKKNITIDTRNIE
jgi:hypothetical protein